MQSSFIRSADWNEWITADGEVTFSRNDLSALRVRGSTYGIRADDPFVTDLPNSFFVGIWERREDGYYRTTNLPVNASFFEKLKEMADLEININDITVK